MSAIDALLKAKELANKGFHVFPVVPENRHPLTENGHLDASDDPAKIEEWWTKHPDAEVGYHTGRSGVVVLDVDEKNGVSGHSSVEDMWLEIPSTFSYSTPNGGTHYVYTAPENVYLSGNARYRGMPGVDRRGGSSFAVFWGLTPPERSELTDSPEWLNDASEPRELSSFEGGYDEWVDTLYPGEPNLLVRRAIERLPVDDMTHEQMVAAQFNAVRLGAEGNPGVPVLLEEIRERWMNRPPGAHTTPQDQWQFKFEEALDTAIRKYGDQIDLVKNLPEYHLDGLPTGLINSLVGEPGGKEEFSRALRAAIDSGLGNDRIASLLWNAPVTKGLAVEWGISFVYERITSARVQPEPIRENPAIEWDEPTEEPYEPVFRTTSKLLTPEEEEIVQKYPSFVHYYLAAGQEAGFANPTYFRSAGWAVASMAFAFKGFIPVSGTDKMGLNLWNITMGESGTGKSRSLKFRDSVLRVLFEGDMDDVNYDLGADSSPQGLHLALLQRDRLPSFLGTDEATRFFKALRSSDWMASLDNTLAHWYEGRVDPSSKINLKEWRGKSALTSFHIQMMATPDEMIEHLDRDMFKSGFLARFNWSIGDPPKNGDERFIALQQDEPTEFDDEPQEVLDVALDLIASARCFEGSRPILATPEALTRISEAHKQMFRQLEGQDDWDIIEPSITRLAEAIRKCAAITAMYRGFETIEVQDVLVAIAAVQEWYDNLTDVAARVSAGDFQRDCDMILSWLAAQGGSATQTRILHAHRNMIRKDPRELDARLNFLVSSGRINRVDINGRSPKFELNGG